MVTLEKKNFPLEWEDVCDLLNLDESSDKVNVQVVAKKKNTKKEKPNYDEKFAKAAEILKTIDGVEFPVELFRFGTYSQYEVAGEEVNKWEEIEIFDDYDLGDNRDELDNLLGFLNKKYIKSIGGDMYGQNVLVLNEDGSTELDGFRI